MSLSMLKTPQILRWVVVLAAAGFSYANISAWTDRSAPSSDDELLTRYAKQFPAADETPATQETPESQPKPKPKAAEGDDPRCERIIKRHLFSPAPPPKEFKSKLTGVLGNKAYFQGGNAVGVGDTHNGAKVTALGPDWVEIEFNGATRKVHVFDGNPGGGGGGPSPSMMRSSRGGPSPMAGRPSMSREGRPSPKDMPPGMIAQMKAQFENLAPEQRAEAMKSMPAEYRELLSN